MVAYGRINGAKSVRGHDKGKQRQIIRFQDDQQKEANKRHDYREGSGEKINNGLRKKMFIAENRAP